jgi:hypothetical protein
MRGRAGSATTLNLWQVAAELSRSLTRIFLRDGDGRRPVYGGTEIFQRDPLWRDLILFYEYFHGDNGAGHRRESTRPGGRALWRSCSSRAASDSRGVVRFEEGLAAPLRGDG